MFSIVLLLILLLSANCLSSRNVGNRREAISKAVAFGAAGLLIQVQPSLAAEGAAPTTAELDRIRLGYKQITYLLDNFEQETTTCRENGGECKRDAEPIRRVLGLRSTTDPLFQIEKVFDKVKNMDVDIDLEEFFGAIEDYNSAMTISNSMAFISQFAEYNPGGGKDSVLKYLEESKKAVLLAQSSLKKIMANLDLKEM
ncbi:hypothetical protein FRACYDRAFT_185490 [Fragilariopsis cylindrus CCMP1102]|uniref:Uncharacterized protein n=1 Tax=Fragilariopsis cylindrus CCMP1102 TaxID=635003 RepID=A0A1E7FFE0_9STRA|nr:hypothetical protein FRACYDRAFT_185490 [Fragilariopsis cylindrus CCMP1102]|eukprot:OEU16765.1 hypothetical protein FRACYDRAFT_185490 [Fragilariopsis cylindrus CCMP1102]